MSHIKWAEMNKEQRAWETYKFVTFASGLIAFGLGGLTVLTLKPNFAFPMLLFLVSPICFFFAWKYLAKIFIKEGIKP